MFRALKDEVSTWRPKSGRKSPDHLDALEPAMNAFLAGGSPRSFEAEATGMDFLGGRAPSTPTTQYRCRCSNDTRFNNVTKSLILALRERRCPLCAGLDLVQRSRGFSKSPCPLSLAALDARLDPLQKDLDRLLDFAVEGWIGHAVDPNASRDPVEIKAVFSARTDGAGGDPGEDGSAGDCWRAAVIGARSIEKPKRACPLLPALTLGLGFGL